MALRVLSQSKQSRLMEPTEHTENTEGISINACFLNLAHDWSLPQSAVSTTHSLRRRMGIKKPARKAGLKKSQGGGAYFFGPPRLNFEVNFSTRPAVSTRRFSPV